MALHHVKMQDMPWAGSKRVLGEGFLYICAPPMQYQNHPRKIGWIEVIIKKIDPMFENEGLTKKLGKGTAESNDRVDLETHLPSSSAIIRPV